MLALLVGLTALAATPNPDDAVVKVVSEKYGKPVPPAAICLEPAELPEAFTGAPVAVGVMRGAAGCRLFGVLVNQTFTPIEEAARTSLGEAWGTLDASQRQALLQDWTREVLLAFDVLDASVPMATKPARSGTEVTATFWQRTLERHVARHTSGRFVFDREGHLAESHRDDGTEWRSTFYVQEQKAQGVTGDQVMQALKSQGQRFTDCMDKAWRVDPTVAGRVQLQWLITKGKADGITMIEEGDTHDALAKCYGNALRRVEFPEEWRGKVLWSFSIDRRQVE